MTNQILRLTTEDLWSVLDLVDPVELVTGELGGPATGDGPQNCRLIAEPATANAARTVLLEDPKSGVRCRFPVSGLHELRIAALVELAAGTLLAPGVVTTAVLGWGPAAALPLAAVARYTPGVTLVALCPADGRDATPAPPRLLELLAETGISLSVADLDEAVFGANLLLLAGPVPDRLRPRQLARGALLVNASGQDLPDHLVNAVDGSYVDDTALLTEGRQVDADLHEVLTGTHPGRTRLDDVLLVELLGVREPGLTFACRLQRAVLELGVGTWLTESGNDDGKE